MGGKRHIGSGVKAVGQQKQHSKGTLLSGAAAGSLSLRNGAAAETVRCSTSERMGFRFEGTEMG